MKRRDFKTVAALILLAGFSPAAARAAVTSSPTETAIAINDSVKMHVDFYGDNIFRIFLDPAGGEMRDPVAEPPAQILVDNPRKATGEIKTSRSGDIYTIQSPEVKIDLNGKTQLMTVTDLRNGKTVLQTIAPIEFGKKSATVRLKEHPSEYFYGGGVQNGRYSHKGKVIDIVNTNSWTDGGVASPTPFYWSTDGYGVMWNTFAPGGYDFGAATPGEVKLKHETPYLDVFVMVDDTPVKLLNDFYQLTGNPVLLPKFGFYEGHLNAYNRDYWTEDEEYARSVLFEDGKKYKESQKDNGGIRESLNGELPGNYQFSARAVIDRYNAADMPLGWILPNDGYGAGYGQDSTLDGNIRNLKEFGDYARSKGVEIGLWTQSDLHPKEGIEALLQRDIVKEVRDAGVRVLKTDVAWVGDGYSFGLNGVSDVAQIMPEVGADARPFIISLDGWAGTQRYAGIWTGDQTGGEWEYIRFHIPTYIGSGLSGQPNITSDMDGIFGGKKPVINVRDFQWKTFTPMELNMDGWGSNPKYPQAMGGKYADINRAYLKLKSQLMPYAYTAAYEAIDGKPLIRAIMLDTGDSRLDDVTRYEFMYGPSLLVAPIYKETLPGEDGDDIRNGIYLPEGIWIDYFSGEKYPGNVVWNMYDAPLWKLPVFVKADAIIPMANPNNNPSEIDKALRIYELWPMGKGEYTEYDDDGTTEAYRNGDFTKTVVTSDVNAKKKTLVVNIAPTTGSFTGFEPNKATELRINITDAPKKVEAKIGGKKVKLTKVNTLAEFNAGSDVYWINENPNRLSGWGEGVDNVAGLQTPQLWIKTAATDIAKYATEVTVGGFQYAPAFEKTHIQSEGASSIPAPKITVNADEDVNPYDITIRWDAPTGAECIEIETQDGVRYTNLDVSGKMPWFTFEDLKPETEYTFKVYAKDNKGKSEPAVLTYRTKDNPLEFAISGMSATCTTPSQPGFSLANLFDFKEKGDGWHTHYRKRDATPFDVTIDLGSFNTLDRLDYVPRDNAGNGTITMGSMSWSENGEDWTEPTTFEWALDNTTKSFKFPDAPLARYVRLHVDKSVGGFGSGSEIYVFKVPGSASYLPGDINNDGKIDENDLTSYINYTGLRRGDSDFDYVSMGDVNRNGLIDAFDINVVASQLGEQDEPEEDESEYYEQEAGADLTIGSISLAADKKSYAAGDEVVVTVKGTDLKDVTAISLALPYSPAKFEYIGVEPLAVKGMENLTYDRLHTDGEKVVYPTFVNIGHKPTVNGTEDLMKLRFRAKTKSAFSSKAESTTIVPRKK